MQNINRNLQSEETSISIVIPVYNEREGLNILREAFREGAWGVSVSFLKPLSFLAYHSDLLASYPP